MSPPASARAFSPASVGNVAVGFDILGHTVAGPGDVATVRRIAEPVVRMAAIRGGVPGLPMRAADNTERAHQRASLCGASHKLAT